jgi:hypothetical protein
LLLSSGLKNKAKEEINMKQVASRAVLASFFLSGFLLGLFFDPEDDVYKLLRNVVYISMECTVLCPR